MGSDLVHVKLKKIGILKITLIFAFFSLLIGILFGFIFFIFLEAVLTALEFNAFPLSTMVFLSFLLIPLAFLVIGSFVGFLTIFIINLSIKLLKGVDLFLEEQESSDENLESISEYNPNN